jgi:outer membrane protein TolC
MIRMPVVFFCIAFGLCSFFEVNGQSLSLKEAVQTALSHYGAIKAKEDYLSASRAIVKKTAREYLPDLNLSIQQDFGTVNAQNGPLYGYRGFSVASSGPLLSSQNWNAVFGGLYLSNINWDFFAFGRAKEKTRLAQYQVRLDSSDWEQEKFQHEVRVAGAYLNLLAAQLLTKSQQDNLERTNSLHLVVVTRARNGLNPGVDSSLADAEVSNAKIALTNARDYEQEQSSVLAEFMGVTTPQATFSLDSFFISRIPKSLADSSPNKQQDHPILQFYQNRIGLSDQQTRYFRTLNYPVFSLFGIFQGRGTGFDYNYGAQNPDAYSHGFWNAVDPTRANYLLGLGLTWNLTEPLRVQQQVAAQKFISKAMKDEYDLINQNLTNQLILSAAKIKNAIANYIEAPIQLKAASDAYTQKSVMYKNGLSTIVDLTQALFTLNRAETQRNIAYNNVWQALLLKAAAFGDFGLFFNEF